MGGRPKANSSEATVGMFEWLVQEMARIRTRKFHLVDGPAPPEFRQAVQESAVPVPPSYEEFVLRFGNARLYRQGGVYLVQVFGGPREARADEGEPLLHFGRTDMAMAYFKEALLVHGGESPVFEWHQEQGLQKTADGFEPWLKARCAAARSLFKKKQWEAIERGPLPFSEREKAIVEARKHFRWRVVGVAPSGRLRFEVHNGSAMTLPYLSVGVRGELRPPKSGPLNGGVWLPVSSVSPGETRIVEKDCYKDLVDPKDVEVFEQPDPEPEDRDRYWEFRALA
jgi:hypothetical protein